MAILGVDRFTDHVTDREALLMGSNLQPCLANLIRNLLTDDVRDLYALLLGDGGALGALHLAAHLLHPLPAGDLLDHLLSGFALSRLHEAANLGLGLGADNLRDLDTLILSVGGAVLLMYSETEILVAVGALLVIRGLTHLLVLCVTILTSSSMTLASASSEAVTSDVMILRLGQSLDGDNK